MLVLLTGLAASARAQDNILLIVADDIGVDQIGAYQEGTDLAPTPVIDSLAASGVMFVNAWSNPLSSPARASLQTGRFPFRTGIGASVFPGDSGYALPLEEVTLPEMLDTVAGGVYSHATIGKWFLGNDSVGGPLAPNLAGYQHFAGTEDNLLDYYDWPRVVDGVLTGSTNYATTQAVDDALEWINSVPEPWFCNLSFHAPHSPVHVPPPELFTVDVSDGTPRSKYKAMIEALDTEIGRLLATLGPTLDHTTIIFLGDNGTSRFVLPPETPYWQAKFTMFEGGVNVPLIITGPPVTTPGTKCEGFTSLTDIYLTVMELASGHHGLATWQQSTDRPILDSVSLVPYLRHPERRSIRRWAYAERFNPNGQPNHPNKYGVAIRNDRYKLILSEGFDFHPDPVALYDLQNDRWEEYNLFLLPSLPNFAQKNYDELVEDLEWIRK